MSHVHHTQDAGDDARSMNGQDRDQVPAHDADNMRDGGAPFFFRVVSVDRARNPGPGRRAQEGPGNTRARSKGGASRQAEKTRSRKAVGTPRTRNREFDMVILWVRPHAQ